MIRSFPPHPNPLPPRARGPSGLAARGEGRPFIPPAELGGILEYFDKISQIVSRKSLGVTLGAEVLGLLSSLGPSEIGFAFHGINLLGYDLSTEVMQCFEEDQTNNVTTSYILRRFVLQDHSTSLPSQMPLWHHLRQRDSMDLSGSLRPHSQS